MIKKMALRNLASFAAAISLIGLIAATAKPIQPTALAVLAPANSTIIASLSVLMGSIDTTEMRTLSGTAIVIATALAAARCFGIACESKPHLTLHHSLHHQALCASYRLVVVNTMLANGSKVPVRPKTAWRRIAQTSPLPDDDIEAIYADGRETLSGATYEQYGWWEVEAMAITTAILKPGRNRNLIDNPSEIAWTCYSFLELPVLPQRRELEGPQARKSPNK